MGFICSEFSHSFLSDICTAFAANFLLEIELFVAWLFGANCDLLILRGICNANGIFKCGLTVESAIVNCGTNGSFFLEISDCGATGLILICELMFNEVCICGAIDCFE